MSINYLGVNLKYLREKRKIEQQDFADLLKIKRSTFSCWESGIRTPKIEAIVDLLAKINEELNENLTLDELICENLKIKQEKDK